MRWRQCAGQDNGVHFSGDFEIGVGNCQLVCDALAAGKALSIRCGAFAFAAVARDVEGDAPMILVVDSHGEPKFMGSKKWVCWRVPIHSFPAVLLRCVGYAGVGAAVALVGDVGVTTEFLARFADSTIAREGEAALEARFFGLPVSEGESG